MSIHGESPSKAQGVILTHIWDPPFQGSQVLVAFKAGNGQNPSKVVKKGPKKGSNMAPGPHPLVPTKEYADFKPKSKGRPPWEGPK